MTLRKTTLLIPVALLLLGAGCLQRFNAGLSGGGLTCEYNGRSYNRGDQRLADDQCNVCSCEETGWSCTALRCLGQTSDSGTISGALSYPGEVLPSQRVCALNLKDDKAYCTHTLAGSATYSVVVPAGTFWVYASSLEAETSAQKAHYSEFVRCGLKAECKDHSPIIVEVEKGKIAAADPQDWYVASWVDVFNVSPSKWEYNTHNYFPSSVFLVKTRNMSRVEIFSTPYPPQENATGTAIGAAEMTQTDGGIQTWKLPIPAGFQGTIVYAVGTAENGDFMKGRELRFVRPIDNASTTVQ